MPKRIGHLWEQMVTPENCIRAEIEMCRNKHTRRKVQRIKDNIDTYGVALYRKLSSNNYSFHKPREMDINESYKRKTRHLKIPCLEDQAAMQAWLNIATPYIVRRNYYYNCGSIPGGGQSRAVNGLKRKLAGRNPPRYAITTDIRKFYDTCPHAAVISGLRRIFKDERFIDFARQIMNSMSDNGIGLAIGYPVSHWFANVALMSIDHDLARLFPDVWHVRYMDDTTFVGNNKRHLRKAF